MKKGKVTSVKKATGEGRRVFSEAVNERLRALWKQYVDERFDGSVNAAADSIGVGQPSAREWYMGEGGLSMLSAMRVCAVVGANFIEVVWPMIASSMPPGVEPPPALPQAASLHAAQSRTDLVPALSADIELDFCLAFHSGRWGQGTVFSAIGFAEDGERHSRHEWVSRLDAIENTIAGLKSN